MLFLQPQLVDPAYKNAPSQTAPGFNDMMQVAKGENWPGYFGSPRYSTAAYGAKLYKSLSAQAVEQALKTLDGTAPQPFRYGTVLSPPDSAGLAHDAEVEKKIQEWLKRKGLK
jgi:hypothetical protein